MIIILSVYFSQEPPACVPREYKRLIRRAVRAAFAREGIKRGCEISVMFTGDEGIRALNRQSRGIDKPTDVLSFPMYERDELAGLFGRAVRGGMITLGDIVVSTETAARQAAAIGHDPGREIAFLCVHSVLHLLGYDHERSRAEDSYMRRRQRSAMRRMRDEG